MAILDAEAVAGDEAISFSVELSGLVDDEVSVDFSTSDNSAKAGENYEMPQVLLRLHQAKRTKD